MERLDLRLVDYFVTVAEELHFGRAAERLHIAQPSLSQQIRRLERQLGVALFDRNSRSVRLTPAGEALLHESRPLQRQAQRAIRSARTAAAASVTVGFYGSAASALLPDVLRVFSARQPGTELFVRELLLGDVEEILDGTVDVAFARLLPGQADLAIEVLTEEPRLVALARAHPLAARDALTFNDLREESFIVNPALASDGTPTRWLGEQRRHGLPGRVAAASASVQEIVTLVAAGRGICLVPSAVARDYQRADVTFLPVIDADPAVVSLVHRRGDPSPGAAAFIRTARDVARKATA